MNIKIKFKIKFWGSGKWERNDLCIYFIFNKCWDLFYFMFFYNWMLFRI